MVGVENIDIVGLAVRNVFILFLDLTLPFFMFSRWMLEGALQAKSFLLHNLFRL